MEGRTVSKVGNPGQGQESQFEIDSSIIGLIVDPLISKYLDIYKTTMAVDPSRAQPPSGKSDPPLAQLWFKEEVNPIMSILKRSLQAEQEQHPHQGPKIIKAALHPVADLQSITGPVLEGSQGKHSAVFVGTKHAKQALGVLFVFEDKKLSLFFQGYFDVTDRHPCAGKSGRIVYANGDYYDGEVAPGSDSSTAGESNIRVGGASVPPFVPVKQGHGSYHHLSKQSNYTGSFANDLPEGQGSESYKDGSQYTGQFSKGRKHGYGELLLKQAGLSYKGHFSNGFFFGEGELSLETQGAVIKGDWFGHKGTKINGTIRYVESGGTYQGEIDGIRLVPCGEGSYTDKTRTLKGRFDDEGRIDGEVLVTSHSGDDIKAVTNDSSPARSKKAIYAKGVFTKWVDVNNPNAIKAPNKDVSPKLIKPNNTTNSPGKLDASTAEILPGSSQQAGKPSKKSPGLWCCSRT